MGRVARPTSNPYHVAYLRLRGMVGEVPQQIGPLQVLSPSRAIGMFRLRGGRWCVAAFDGEQHWLERAYTDYAAAAAYDRIWRLISGDDELPDAS